MKKAIGIVVLGLLFCGNSFAELLDLGNGVKINIPNNFEYIQVDDKKFTEMNSKALGVSQKEIDMEYREYVEARGYTGTEKLTLIGPKGFKNSYGKMLHYYLTGKDSEAEKIAAFAVDK